MKKFGLSNNVLVLFFIAIGVIICAWPLLRPGFFITDDGEWMIIRLSAFFQTLREGQFPVRFLTRLNNNYGYPVSNFLYPGYLYAGSLLHGAGLSFLNSVKALFVGSFIIGAFGTYKWLRSFFSKTASCAGAIAFLFAPYVLFDIYSRGSVGEVLSISLATVGLYSVAQKKLWLFPPVIAALILSHNSQGLIFSFVLFSYIVVIKAKEFIMPFVIGIGLATFFWLPALYERRYVLFDSLIIADPTHYFIGVNQLWLFGIPTLVAVCVVLLRSIKKYRTIRLFIIGMFFLSLFAATPVSRIFWSNSAVSSFFQFPFRLLSISTIAGSWIIAYSIDVVSEEKRIFFMVLCILGWALSYLFIIRSIDYVNRPEGYYTTNEATTTVKDEYMPKWVTQKMGNRANNRIEFVSGTGSILSQPVSSQHIEFTADVKHKGVLQVNMIYYPGWGATIDNEPVSIDYTNAFGLIRFPVAAGTHHVIVEFRETVFRFICNVMSFVSLLFGLGYFFLLRKKVSLKG